MFLWSCKRDRCPKGSEVEGEAGQCDGEPGFCAKCKGKSGGFQSSNVMSFVLTEAAPAERAERKGRPGALGWDGPMGAPTEPPVLSSLELRARWRYRLQTDMWRPSFNFTVSGINPYKVQGSINRLTLAIVPPSAWESISRVGAFKVTLVQGQKEGVVRQTPRHQAERDTLCPCLSGTHPPRAV